MSLSQIEIEDIAKLARLEISEQEKEMYAEQLSAIFSYISLLNELDTEDVVETSQVTGLEDVVRQDEVIGCELKTREKLIKQFPDRLGDLLKIKGVFSE